MPGRARKSAMILPGVIILPVLMNRWTIMIYLRVCKMCSHSTWNASHLPWALSMCVNNVISISGGLRNQNITYTHNEPLPQTITQFIGVYMRQPFREIDMGIFSAKPRNIFKPPNFIMLKIQSYIWFLIKCLDRRSIPAKMIFSIKWQLSLYTF